jgi:ABC-type uncharacterized transport system involved in gliding motility auxiliary subunit
VNGVPPGLQISELQGQLAKSYEVRSFNLADSTQPASDVSLLVLLGSPDTLTPAQAERFQRFFDRGGSALVLASGMRLAQEMPAASPRPVAWNRFLKPFGVTIRPDMAYDLMANEIVPLPSDMGQVLQSYPLFIRARSTAKSSINQEVNEVTLTWTSTVDTTGAPKGAVTPLLVSSPGSGTLTSQVSIDPTQSFPQHALAPRVLAAAATGGGAAGAPKGRVVVVGSADFINDRFVSRAPDNLSLALNAVDWLGQDEALISIRSKDRRPPPLVFSSASVREGVKYANVIGMPALVALCGIIRLLRRRRKTRESYRPAEPGAAPAPQEQPA